MNVMDYEMFLHTNAANEIASVPYICRGKLRALCFYMCGIKKQKEPPDAINVFKLKIITAIKKLRLDSWRYEKITRIFLLFPFAKQDGFFYVYVRTFTSLSFISFF